MNNVKNIKINCQHMQIEHEFIFYSFKNFLSMNRKLKY